MKKMQVYQLQITPPHEEEINDIITRRDYTYSHIIFEGEDLGSLDEIRRMRRSIDYMHHQILFQLTLIDDLINNNKLSGDQKKFVQNFKRRKK